MATSSPAAPKAKRAWWLRFCLLAALIGLTVFIWGFQRWSTGSANGEGQSGLLPAPDSSKSIFRIGTFNMHSGVGEDDVFNLSRTIDSVRDTDVCGLNEVRGRFSGQPQNQAQELAEATNHAWIYLPTERRFWHDDFGNGVITRLPVIDWCRFPLPIEPSHGGLRNATLLHVRFGATIASLVVTHIDRSRDQTNQLKMIRQFYDSLKSPSLLLGDLNADSSNPQVKSILALPDIHDCITEGGGQPDNRIDWILSRGFKSIHGGEIKNGASDHPMYWVDLQPDMQK